MERIDKDGGRDHQESADVGNPQQGGESSGVDLRRRRMMRGAAVAVPALVTLRSGGLAAASLCPGHVAGVVQNLSGSTTPPGFFQSYTINGVRTAPHTGDYCYTQVEPGTCTFPRTQSAIGGAGQVQAYNAGTVPGYYCSGYSTAGNPKTVYILTHSSAVSIIP